ncbi:MAG: DUF502 domain-containing protein [Candidatus Zapsychrus exili]|nr:DUF502 domain-containing protein [Candidatus Zapsychrus exili]
MLSKLKKYFISGLITFLPVALTIYLFTLVVNLSDGLLGKYLEPYFFKQFGFYFRGIGIFVGVVIIVILGSFVRNFLGNRLHKFFESILLKLPFVKKIYPALKEMAVFLFSRERMGSFRQVVIVQYPKQDVYSYGFLTNESAEEAREQTGKELCNVFIPSAPGPLTGFAVMIPKEDIIFTDIKIEDAFKFIVSGGVVNPS